jgi:hypothetical protein
MTAARVRPSAGCNLRGRMRFTSILALVCVAAVALAGCGDKEGVVKDAQEGTTITVGGLDYQLQLSRYLNPNDQEDRYYLRGLPAGSKLDPGKDKVWFAIFMRVKNQSGGTLTSTNDFAITDTQNNSFSPVQMDVTKNPFLYQPVAIPHAGVNPEPETPSATGPIQGSMILFSISQNDLQNRPLVLHIKSGDDSGTMELDL